MSAPLVLLPGWGLGRGPLTVVANALGGEVFDLPGYGEAPLIDDFDSAIDAIASYLPPGTTLAGWSLGALLALGIAARAPDKVGRLILVAGTASFIQRDGWPNAMPPTILAEFAAGVAADAATQLPRFVGGFCRGDAQARSVNRQLLELGQPWPAATTLATGLAWLGRADLRAAAPLVRAPTLLIHGTADPLMPLAAGQALAALIPGARLSVMNDCAHAPFTSRPDDFVTRVQAFLHAT